MSREKTIYGLSEAAIVAPYLAELETIRKERDEAVTALRVVQNAAKTLSACQNTELQHLRQNATFDHRIRAEHESLLERDAMMTEALDEAEAARDAAIARAEAAERERDWHKSLTQSHDLLADNAALKTRAEAAERERDEAREVRDATRDGARVNTAAMRKAVELAQEYKSRAEAAEAKVAELTKEVAEWRSRPDALRADKAEAKVAKLRKVLEFYSNRMTYTARSGMECGITQDHFGDRARAVLQETEQ